MREFARFRFALVGLTVMAPAVVLAQAPAMNGQGGYAPGASAPAQAPAQAPAGLDGRTMASSAPSAGYSMPAEAPHAHKGRKMCASCAAKAKAQQNQMNMGGQIVACAHSKNGVCPACRDLLAMPGTVTMGAPGMAAAPAAASAPGRAIASSSPMPSPSSPGMMAGRGKPGVYTPYNQAQRESMDDSMSDPAPIGVVQAGYAQQPGGPMGMPAQAMAASSASQPGRAVAQSAAGSTPFQPKTGYFPHPRIIGHLLGMTGIGSERREEMAQKKAESHAMISYDGEGTTVNEISPSLLKKGR